MYVSTHEPSRDEILRASLRVLADGNPLTAAQIAKALRWRGINIHKSLVNSILFQEGKSEVLYSTSTYTYQLKSPTSSKTTPAKSDDRPVEQAQPVASINQDLSPQSKFIRRATFSFDLQPKDIMSRHQANQAIESLRFGIPPEHLVSYFTVGRDEDMSALLGLLNSPAQAIMLICANYGSGKSHLLKIVRELALKVNFAVSLVTLDAKSGVSFSRLDDVFGAVCTNLIIPGHEKGIRYALDGFAAARKFYRWKSAPIELAANFWVQYGSNPSAAQAIEDWLANPRKYTTISQQERLYLRIRGKSYLDSKSRDDINRRRGQGAFNWTADDYGRTWSALADLHQLTLMAGSNGLILLFDEFEDVITNMTKAQQNLAFTNLFKFYSGNYPCLAIFAVTPQFVERSHEVVSRKSLTAFVKNDFLRLPRREIQPLGYAELLSLGKKIVAVYEYAEEIRFPKTCLTRLEYLANDVLATLVPDYPRAFVKRVTEMLDSFLE